MHSQEMSRLVSGLPHDEYLKECGRTQMIETLFSLIENLDNSARAIDEHKRNADTVRSDISARSKLAFAGSAWWDVATKPGV